MGRGAATGGRVRAGGRALRTCGELGPGEKPDGLLLPSPYFGFSIASGRKTWRPRKRMSSSVAARLPSRSSSSSRWSIAQRWATTVARTEREPGDVTVDALRTRTQRESTSDSGV